MAAPMFVEALQAEKVVEKYVLAFQDMEALNYEEVQVPRRGVKVLAVRISDEIVSRV
jgi:hypothetical protein